MYSTGNSEPGERHGELCGVLVNPNMAACIAE